jgi:outer membrane protein assembly factor BamB
MRSSASFSCFLGFVLATLVSSATAQEWTRFRGPNGTGESETTNIPASWTEKDLNWRIELPGIGHSSPVLWGDKVFILSADPKEATRYVLGINANNGKILWKKEYPGVPHHLHANSSFASVTPACDAERVYVAWSDPDFTRLMALDHSGNEVWTINLGPWISQHGFGCSPMLYQDLVVLNCSQEDSKRPGDPKPTASFIVAVEQSTGKIRWRTDRKIDSASYSVPTVRKTEAGPDELLCNTQGEGLFALDPKTGKENWAAPVLSMRSVSCPLYVAGLVFGTTGSGGGGHYLVTVKPGKEPEEAYRIKTVPVEKQSVSVASYVGTPVCNGNLMFMFEDTRGHATCIDAATGKVHWFKPRFGTMFFGSPVRAGNKIFVVDTEGTVICVAADKEFKELGRTELKELCRSTPAVANGKLYVRTVSHLLSVGGKVPSL